MAAFSPINVRLPRDLHEAATARAQAEDRSLAATIRVALRFYLDYSSPNPLSIPLSIWNDAVPTEEENDGLP